MLRPAGWAGCMGAEMSPQLLAIGRFRASLFDLKVADNIHSRIMNPTNGLLDARLAALEDGVGAPAALSR